MRTEDSRIINRIGIVLLYTAPVVSVGCCYLLTNETVIDVFSNVLLALISAGMYFTLLHVNQGFLYQRISHKLLYFISFFISFLFLGVSTGFCVGIMWMTVVAIAALDCGLELAVSTHVVLMIQYAFLILPQDQGFYHFSGYILLGMVVALLFSVLENPAAIFYLALILLACDWILQLVVCRFSPSLLKKNGTAALIETGSVLFLVLLGKMYLKKFVAGQKEPEVRDSLERLEPVFIGVEEELELEEEKGIGQREEEAQLQMLTASDYELVLRLQEYSEEILKHSQRISILSEKAAEAIGGNKMLAKAGGLYHEIGRIENEENYIVAGNRIGQEYGFPEKLLAIMRQHSANFEPPESVEAAVVMLSECIISTSEYLIKSGKRGMLSDEQLVGSVFRNRLEKGNLKSSGMTVGQMQDLRDFYIKNAFSE